MLPLDHFKGHAKVVEDGHGKIVARQFSVLAVRRSSDRRIFSLFVKGLFQDTLPLSPIGSIALLHIDGDWYESARICRESLYDKVAPGGVIQFDDYGYWKEDRKAVNEFLAQRGCQPAA